MGESYPGGGNSRRVIDPAKVATLLRIGFPNSHGAKIALVRRMIDECHYNAFFIESGIYDFLNIQKKLRSGQEVTESMIAAAIGGL